MMDLYDRYGVDTPHFTALQKASKRLPGLDVANEVLSRSVTTFRKSNEIAWAVVDSRGLAAKHLSRYLVRRKRSKQFRTE